MQVKFLVLVLGISDGVVLAIIKSILNVFVDVSVELLVLFSLNSFHITGHPQVKLLGEWGLLYLLFGVKNEMHNTFVSRFNNARCLL